MSDFSTITEGLTQGGGDGSNGQQKDILVRTENKFEATNGGGDHMVVPDMEEYDYVTLDDVAHFKTHHKRKTSTNSLLSTTSSYNAGGSIRLSDDAWSYTNSSIGTWESPDLADEMLDLALQGVAEEEGEEDITTVAGSNAPAAASIDEPHLHPPRGERAGGSPENDEKKVSKHGMKTKLLGSLKNSFTIKRTIVFLKRRAFLGLRIDRLNRLTPLKEECDDRPRFLSFQINKSKSCLLYTSPSPRDRQKSRMPSSA